MTLVMRNLFRPAAALLVLLLAGTASAGLSLTNLPDSSYYAGGRSNIYKLLGNGQVLSGRLEFNVYDTQDHPSEFSGTVGGSGRFVYAYQLIINSTNSLGLQNVGTDYFSISGISLGALNAVWIGSSAEGAGAPSISPSGQGTEATDATSGLAYWEFLQNELEPGTQSVFMVLRSNGTPTKAKFAVVRQDNDNLPVPGDGDSNNNIPEPASLLLLSGGVVLINRIRRSR